MLEFNHLPIMPGEVIDGLNITPSGVYIDGTCGGAGHSVLIAKKLNADGLLIGIDRDPDAVKTASVRLETYPAVVRRGNFSDLKEIAALYDITAVDGILFDLGVSSFQLDNAERGFSYHADAPLDMRMSKEGLSAFDVVNDYPEDELRRILYEYGEERFAPRIVSLISERRRVSPINTTAELADIIKEAYPAKFRREKNPCKKTFQAIRIEVNGEFEEIGRGIDDGFSLLKPGGRMAVITFHSLEDRLVKQRFVSFSKGCTCPPDFPRCVCGKTAAAKLITRKPITASPAEIKENNRSRSAKLRVIEKLR
ncbi:MAG: 16S rRNA (cytosine(1402)-N(4))-methyltransferase RsmH [Ruminococcus sp.]|jgi:16S rRNA (cytosine1402-N4)-methyltransferase|nr:16S rRNA (cytosine(1402)-N(4))-methyltransferase RsmH [Ruminococcus sp.]